MAKSPAKRATTPLDFGNEQAIQMPAVLGQVNWAVPMSAPGLAVSSPVIGEQYRLVRLEAIVGDSPLQTRRPFDPSSDEDDQALLESLAQNGQRVPVLLVEDTQTAARQYRPLDGHRRLAALRHLGQESVKAIIHRANSLECDLITLTTHVRKNLSPVEQAQAIERLRDRHQLTPEEIIQKVGISRAYFYQLRQLAQTDPAVQATVAQAQLSARAALVIGTAPLAEQPELARVAANHSLSESQTKHLVAQVATTGQTPQQAAQTLGLAAVRSAQPGSTAEPEQQSSEAFQRLVRRYFPELAPRSMQLLAECVAQNALPASALKVAGLLVLAGWEVAEALQVAPKISQHIEVRKILALNEWCADFDQRLASHTPVPECAPLLAGLVKRLSAIKQAVLLSQHEAPKKKRGGREERARPMAR